MEQISAADVKEKSSNKSKRERYSAESDGGLKESDAASAWGGDRMRELTGGSKEGSQAPGGSS